MNIKSVTYHRNGSSGRSFYVVAFTEPGSPELLAILPSDPKTGQDAECYVVDSADVGQRWRGDEFQADLLRAVDEWIARHGEMAPHERRRRAR